MVFLSLGLYKNRHDLTERSKLETIIKKCRERLLLDELKRNENIEFNAVYRILNELKDFNREFREWSNSIKHRGGILVEGLEPIPMYEVKILDNKGAELYSSKEFLELNDINIDIDAAVIKLADYHVKLASTIKSLYEVIFISQE